MAGQQPRHPLERCVEGQLARDALVGVGSVPLLFDVDLEKGVWRGIDRFEVLDAEVSVLFFFCYPVGNLVKGLFA